MANQPVHTRMPTADQYVIILMGVVAILITWIWLGLGSAIIIVGTQDPVILKDITDFLALMLALTVMVSETQEGIAKIWLAENPGGGIELSGITIIYGMVAIPTMVVWLILLGLAVISALLDPEAKEQAAALIAALGFMAMPVNDMRRNLLRKLSGRSNGGDNGDGSSVASP